MQPGLLTASRAVALMAFTKSDGLSYLCTGSLLNTASYPRPIFLTAFHCLSDTESLASLTTVWFFSRSACESGPPSPTTTQVAGGAIGIFGNAALDAALVLLNQMPPPAASYTGWDASTMQSATTILAIHHPSGDVKKASFGIDLGINPNAVLFDIGTFPAGSFYVVSWELGIVEHGSSGSGLLSFNLNNNSFYLRGTLTGGDATCTSNHATTYYSRLDNLYPYIQTALNQPLPPPVTTTVAVEYYYATWNFYFETSFTDEIAGLDGGAFGGAWKRTGQTFNVWPQSNPSASPTCRFFSTAFAPKSSHFYTPFASECAIVKTNAAWQYEAIAFYIQLADVNGLCSGGTIPLYRLYNNGMGGAPNHRYTTSATIFNQMVAAGWIFEGNGNTKVFACVP
jgi:lysyl endopeptidase